MSLLGFMIVSRNGDDISVVKYEFVDIVVAGYSGQDNVQVAAIIPHVLEYLHFIHPEIEKVYIQSNNASCFSSQEHIPYIHQKNEGWVSTMGMHVEG
eukprot:2696864-Ditylum_brightwellii.AAC.1